MGRLVVVWSAGSFYVLQVSDFFSSVEFESYGPITSGTLALTRLHALIGPNDSGKTSALRGLRLAASLGRREHGDDLSLLRKGAASVGATRGDFKLVENYVDGKPTQTKRFAKGIENAHLPDQVFKTWGPARMIRADPDALRSASALISDGVPLDFANERGTGLGALLDAIFSRSVKDYLALETRITGLFPTVQGFRLFTTAAQRTVGITLKDGTEIRPDQMSEGMLYFLSYAVLPYLSPASVILIEEPENGLHPARIAEVMKVLRKISETTQIVLATHSPLVVNELNPEEVTLVTRTVESGTRFTPISETENFKRRASAFSLGELWLNYADGVSEAPLFKATGSTT